MKAVRDCGGRARALCHTGRGSCTAALCARLRRATAGARVHAYAGEAHLRIGHTALGGVCQRRIETVCVPQ